MRLYTYLHQAYITQYNEEKKSQIALTSVFTIHLTNKIIET